MVCRSTVGRVLVAALIACAPMCVFAQGEGTSAGNSNNGNFDASKIPMISRDEAEKFLPPPIKVVDLSKPGNVYKASDPMVAAAVADYLSKIKEPHDQYGNIISKNYKSATLPDTVDSKVIAAIVAYVGNQRLVALSPRAAQSLNATQQIQRQKDIDRIIYDDWAAKVRNAADGFNKNAQRNRDNLNNANGGNANTAGPGPTSNPIPTGTPTGTPTATPTPTPTPTGNTNNTNGAGGGNGNQNNGNVGGGNENVPNLNNGNRGNANGNTNTNTNNSNGGGGGTTAAALQTEFGVEIIQQPQAWTEVELGDLRDVLTKLPKLFYAGVQFKRAPGISPANGAPVDPNILGVTFNSGQTAGDVTLADGYEKSDRVTKQDWPNPPWGPDEGVRQHAKAILAHELTHNFQFYGTGRRLSALQESPIVQDFATKFGWTFDSATSKWSFDKTRRDQRISQYAIGTPDSPTSPMEDMAESVSFYLYDPDRLKATAGNGQSRYDFVRDVLKVAEQPQDPTHHVGTPVQRGVGI